MVQKEEEGGGINLVSLSLSLPHCCCADFRGLPLRGAAAPASPAAAGAFFAAADADGEAFLPLFLGSSSATRAEGAAPDEEDEGGGAAALRDPSAASVAADSAVVLASKSSTALARLRGHAAMT